MEPVVDVLLDKSLNLVVGDVVFALFDQVWYQGIFQELRPNNKRDKYFCRFEDGDKRSMNINSLFKAIPANSKWSAFSQPETSSTTEAPNLSIVSDVSLDIIVDAEKSVNQLVEATAMISINNDISDSKHVPTTGMNSNLFSDLTSSNLYSLVHKDGPSTYTCIYKETSDDKKCKNNFNSLQRYQEHLDKHISNSILGTVTNELLEFIGSVICTVCKKLVAKRVIKSIHPKCEKHSIQSNDLSSSNVPVSSDVPVSSNMPVSPASSLPSLHSISLISKSFLYTTPPPQILDTWREIYSKIINDVVNHNNIYYWSLYYMLPYCILVRPNRGGNKNSSKKAQLNLLYSRLKRWKEGDYLLLWNEIGRAHV